MTLSSELHSWFTWAQPASIANNSVPKPGDRAPSTAKLPLPSKDSKTTFIVFLRHCGCPFAEKTFKQFRQFAASHPDIHCVAVSQSEEPHTQKWLSEVGGASEAGSSHGITVVVDSERDSFGHWGLGMSSWLHVLDPRVLWNTSELGKQGINVRDTESGNRWQTGGYFAVDGQGIVRWGHAAEKANDIPEWEEAVRVLAGRDSKL